MRQRFHCPHGPLLTRQRLLLVLVLVPVLMGPPYANLGRADAEGNRYYRAYFTADFLWHSALAFEVGKFSLPPRNPYLTPRAMNYYWTYFLLPATAAELVPPSPAGFVDLQRYLKANAILSGLLMMGALFLVVRSAVPRPGPAALAVALAVLAASAEGLYAIVDLVHRGAPLAALSDMNVDAVTAWFFNGLRVDNVPRSLWYTPQHTTAVALGLVGWLIAISAGSAASIGAIAGAGLALGLATTMNPLLGGCFSLVYGTAVAADAIGSGQFWQRIPRHAIAAVPVALAVLWGWASKVMDGAGSALQIGLFGIASHSPVITLGLSLGPILIALAGRLPPVAECARTAGLDRERGHRSGPVPALLRAHLGSFLGGIPCRADSPRLDSDPARARVVVSWSAYRRAARAGHPCRRRSDDRRRYVERAGHRQPSRRTGLPLDALDYSGPAAGVCVDTREHAADRGRADGAHGPRARALDAHPVLCGTPHGRRSPDFAPAAAGVSRAVGARQNDLRDDQCEMRRRRQPGACRIDYLYVDATDTHAYPDGVRKFDEYPKLFSRVFASGDVRVYRVE